MWVYKCMEVYKLSTATHGELSVIAYVQSTQVIWQIISDFYLD